MKTTLLHDFHTQFTSTFNALPETGRFIEITKRVSTTAIAIFAYPLLSALYLAERLYEACRKILPVTPPPQEKRSFLISDQLTELKRSLSQYLQEITPLAASVPSGKIFFNLTLDGKLKQKDYTLLDNDYDVNLAYINLAFIIDDIIDEIKESYQNQTTKQFNFTWDALIRKTHDTFARAHGAISNDGSGFITQGGSWNNIPAAEAEKNFALVLQKMNRPLKPLLNKDLNFV